MTFGGCSTGKKPLLLVCLSGYYDFFIVALGLGRVSIIVRTKNQSVAWNESGSLSRARMFLVRWNGHIKRYLRVEKQRKCAIDFERSHRFSADGRIWCRWVIKFRFKRSSLISQGAGSMRMAESGLESNSQSRRNYSCLKTLQLQNKSDRNYIKNAPRGTGKVIVYLISDLNIENKEIVRPFSQRVRGS